MSRNPIQDNFVILCTQLNLEKILPYLKQERMVTTDEYEILTNPNFTTRQKREKLLIWLPRKGRNYFTNFGKCLVWSGQTELARHIGVDVALVPEAPFKLSEEPTPEEQQQQMMNLLRSMISNAQQTPPASLISASLPTSAHHQRMPTTGPSVGVAPSQSLPAVYGGGGVPVVVPHNDIHQPSSNTGINIYLPSSGGGPNQVIPANQPSSTAVQPSVAEPMELSGPAIPVYQRTDRNVLRASTANEEVIQTKRQVFILYCKDPVLPASFSDDILDLADTLNHCGGFTCTIDHYVDVPPANWNTWTQQRIEESQYVILVCSPTLAQMMRMPHDYTLNMEKGKYFANGIVNLIHPPKFIPIYLNGHKPGANQEWLPPQLRMYTAYNLNITELSAAIQVPEGTPRYILDKKLTDALSDERFREITKLVHHLRSESETAPPVPPQVPIQIPPAIIHTSPLHGPSQVVHPQSDVSMQHALGAPVKYGVQPQLFLPNAVETQSGAHHPVPVSADDKSLHLVEPEQQQLLFETLESQGTSTTASHQFITPVQPQGDDLEADNIPDITVRRIALRVKYDWFNLGMKLKVDCAELEAIQKGLNHPTDYEVAVFKMIHLWKRTKRELATVQALKQALIDMEYGRLAQELFQDDEMISHISSR